MIKKIILSTVILVTSLYPTLSSAKLIKPLNKKVETLKKIYETHKSPASMVMASSLVKSKRPALYTSLSIEESLGDPNAIGDHGNSFGAFQIQSRHYGKVPKHIDGQLKKAEEILENLILKHKGKLRKALAEYNGGTKPSYKSFKYADRILSRAYLIRKELKTV